MACVAVTSLMRTIELEFLQSNPRLIFQDREHIKSLHEKLGVLQMFLDESEKKADYYEELNDLIATIREVALKAEYDIEEELIEIHHHTVDQTLRRVLQDVEQLVEKTKNAHHLAKDLQILHLENPSTGGQSPLQRTPKLEDTVVGHAKEFEDLKYQLLGSSNEPRQVMALVGMVGIGKTTFARRIYEDSAVKSYFDCCGWATISEDLNKRQVLLDLCRSVMPMRDDLNTQSDSELAQQLRRSLLGHRYLIILDDIWTTEAWDEVNRCFPEDDKNTCTGVLLTTRLQEVADYACSSKLIREMRFLNSEESWNLFYQKLLIKECLNEEFETIGRNIVENCGGLPLTVVVLAGHLSANMAVDEWKSVESTLNSLVNLNLSQQFSRIFYLSYNNLPCHLKSCFLYLGAFPEDSEIGIKKIIRLWIAEGFVKEVSDRTLEESGKDYLDDLINRSLIMKGRRSTNGEVETCKMHDLLHELCASKAEKDKLLCTRDSLKHGGNVHSDGNRWLRLKIVSQRLDHLNIVFNKSRSILCFDMREWNYPDWHLSSLASNSKMIANSFKMLRVMDLTLFDYKGSLPSDTIHVVLLRYLALASNWLLTSIPVWKNRNLQTLIICEDINGVRRLPRGIWDLPQLRHLELHHQLPMYTPEVVQLNLQTMYWLQCIQCTEQVLLRIPNVRELGMIIAQGCRCHSCLDNLNCLNKLEKLKVQGSYCPIKLPTHADAFPQNLKKITFAKTLIPWEAMGIISMLPKLKELKLKNHACLGKKWELTAERGFPELKLLIISVTDLEHWVAAADDFDSPFPCLERLILRNCFELKKMPGWIENLSNLKSVQLEHCYACLVRSAKEIQEDQKIYYSEECAFEILEFDTQSEDIDEVFEEQMYAEEHIQVYRIEARSLLIEWVTDSRYWTWTWDSGYEVAELVRVWWLDIRGRVDTRRLTKMTSYSAYLLYKIKLSHQGIDLIHSSLTYVNDDSSSSEKQMSLAGTRSSAYCSNGWMEIKLGEFDVGDGNEGVLEVRLWNTADEYWKSGLFVRDLEPLRFDQINSRN